MLLFAFALGCAGPDEHASDAAVDSSSSSDTGAAHDTACAPGEEVCNGVDDDCDGDVDEPLDGAPRYADVDADGWGEGVATACDPAVDRAGDCDDADPSRYPGAIETCDGRDEDCDGEVDELGAIGCADGWIDEDGDGVGIGEPVCVCEGAGSAYTALEAGDCDDADAWRALDCSEAVELAEYAAAIVGEEEDLALGTGSSAAGSRTLGGDGTWLYLPAEGRNPIVSVPSGGQVGVDVVTVSSVGFGAAAIGDLDGDGVDDLVTSVRGDLEWYDRHAKESYYRYDIGLISGPFEGDVDAGRAAFELATPCASAFAWSMSVAGDVNADGRDDLVHNAECDAQLVRWTDEERWEVLVVDTFETASDVGDVNADGFDDLVLEDRVFYGPDAGVWSPEDADVVTDWGWGALDAGDIDGDGDSDYVIQSGGSAFVVDGFATGWLEDVAFATIGADDYRSEPVHALGDLDGDGRTELAVTYDGVHIFLGPLVGRRGVSSAEFYLPPVASDTSFGSVVTRVDDGPRIAVTSPGSDLGAPDGGAVFLFELPR